MVIKTTRKRFNLHVWGKQMPGLPSQLSFMSCDLRGGKKNKSEKQTNKTSYSITYPKLTEMMVTLAPSLKAHTLDL